LIKGLEEVTRGKQIAVKTGPREKKEHAKKSVERKVLGFGRAPRIHVIDTNAKKNPRKKWDGGKKVNAGRKLSTRGVAEHDERTASSIGLRKGRGYSSFKTVCLRHRLV